MTGFDTSYADLLDDIRKEFPSFKLVAKQDSLFMKLIAGFLFLITFGLQRKFMTEYITTVGCHVYVPPRWYKDGYVSRMIVLRHERIHMRQRRRYTMPLFTLLYVLLPLPGGLAYFRAKFEMEAYEETLKAIVDLCHDGAERVTSAELRDEILSYFIGASYCWMWPFRKRLERWYADAVNRALAKQPAE